MAVNIRPPVDERIIGKMSIRHSFIAIAIFSGMFWAVIFVMFREMGEREVSYDKQVLILTVLGIWILFWLCMAFIPRQEKLVPEHFIRHLRQKGLLLQNAEQVTAVPYGNLPGSASVCIYHTGSAAVQRFLAQLPQQAEDGNAWAVNRLGLLAVYFFPNRKKALSAQVFVSSFRDCRVVYYKNTIICYYGKDQLVHTFLLSLQDKK